MINCLICAIVFWVSPVCAMNTFDGKEHPLVHITLAELTCADSDAPNYNKGDAEWKNEFAKIYISMHHNLQNELRTYFEKLLPTIADPVEHELIKKDLQSLICNNPLNNTPAEVADRTSKIIEYRNGYKGPLNKIISKNGEKAC